MRTYGWFEGSFVSEFLLNHRLGIGVHGLDQREEWLNIRLCLILVLYQHPVTTNSGGKLYIPCELESHQS